MMQSKSGFTALDQFTIFKSLLLLDIYFTCGDVIHMATYKKLGTTMQTLHGTRVGYFSSATLEVSRCPYNCEFNAQHDFPPPQGSVKLIFIKARNLFQHSHPITNLW